MTAYLIRKMAGRMPVWFVKLLGNFYPPYIGSGIRILDVAADFSYIKVCLKFSWYNRNYVGTQFGGSMYSMTDPFYMMMLIQNLGDDYVVWDKAAVIDFKKPGRTELFAEFRISHTLLHEVRDRTKTGEKYIFDLPVEVKDTSNNVVAHVTKTLYVRRKHQN